MKVLQIIALILTIIGAINWGMIALFNLDLVASLFGVRSLVNIGLLVDLFED